MKKDITMSSQLILLICVLSTLLMAVGTFGLVGAKRSTEALKTVYADRTVPIFQLSEVVRLMQRSWVILALASAKRTPEYDQMAAEIIDHDVKEALANYAAYLKTGMTPEEVVLSTEFTSVLEKITQEGLLSATRSLKARDYDEALRIQTDVMIPLARKYRSDLQALTKLQLDVANKEYRAAIKRADDYWLASVVSMAAGGLFAVFFGGYLARNIIRSKQEFEKSLQDKRELERQLQQSQKAQALGQLTGGIAHDFNNILAAVLGYANLALDKHAPDPDSKLTKYLREIVTASERARDLVAKMLTFTRTQPSNNVALISPATVVNEVHSMMRPSIPSSIEIKIHTEDFTEILADAGELNQMLVNLLINARDAIAEKGNGGGTIELLIHKFEVTNQVDACTQRRFSGSFFGIEVSDTGAGIAPENVHRVFDPFFTTKEVGKGTGLGLSMVQGIMMRAGGHIVLKTAPGKGTCFKLLFPTPLNAVDHIAAQGNAALPSLAQGQLIWIVDDEPAITGFMHELLSDQGYATRTFNDPRMALAAFIAERPNLHALITDATMPGLSGPELVKHIHQLNPSLPVVFCTGMTDGQTTLEFPSSGVCRLLLKPVASADLFRAIAQINTS